MPLAADAGRICHSHSNSVRIRRLVLLSSTTRAGMPTRRDWSG